MLNKILIKWFWVDVTTKAQNYCLQMFSNSIFAELVPFTILLTLDVQLHSAQLKNGCYKKSFLNQNDAIQTSANNSIGCRLEIGLYSRLKTVSGIQVFD